MLGKDHMKMNIAGLACLTGFSHINSIGLSHWNAIRSGLRNWLWPEKISPSFDAGMLFETFVFLGVASLLFYVGTYLPDMDSETSRFGKIGTKLGLTHRTWTHSIWMILGTLVLTLIHPVFRFLFLGVLGHILCDMVSAAGICLLYPFRQYIYYDSGAFVAPGHRVKLYHTGQRSEQVFVGISCLLLWGFTLITVLFGGSLSFFIGRLFQ